MYPSLAKIWCKAIPCKSDINLCNLCNGQYFKGLTRWGPHDFKLAPKKNKPH